MKTKGGPCKEVMRTNNRPRNKRLGDWSRHYLGRGVSLTKGSGQAHQERTRMPVRSHHVTVRFRAKVVCRKGGGKPRGGQKLTRRIEEAEEQAKRFAEGPCVGPTIQIKWSGPIGWEGEKKEKKPRGHLDRDSKSWVKPATD